LWVQRRKAVDDSFLLPGNVSSTGLDTDTLSSEEISNMEKVVLASTQERLDMKRVAELLLERESNYSEQWDNIETTSVPPSTGSIALAAAIVTALATDLFSHSWSISFIIFVLAFVIASGDPLDEEGIAGSIARIVGRTTLKSIDVAKPKIRAVARAAVIGEAELASLMTNLGALEQENYDLRSSVQSYLREDDYFRSSVQSYSTEDDGVNQREEYNSWWN